MKTIPIGVQLYSVREDCAHDLPGTLKAVAEMGYDGVEFAGYYDYSAQDLRKILDENGLKCCGSHIRLDMLLGEAFEATVEFNQILGNRYLIVPSLPPERRSSNLAWRETGALFSQIAEKLAPYNMLTGYHNHAVEFEVVDGETGFDAFFSNTHPAVIMQLDLGNALHGGADPMDYLRRYPQRLGTVHLKEYSATNPNALLGEGDVPWTQVFEICENQGSTEWYIVEQETYAVPPLETIRRCRQALKKMGR
jgi:sugar phosphate isomerase/epimerase